MVIKDSTMMQNAKYVLCQGQKSRSSDIVWTRDDAKFLPRRLVD